MVKVKGERCITGWLETRMGWGWTKRLSQIRTEPHSKYTDFWLHWFSWFYE